MNRDRTQEFFQCAESISLRNESHHLLSNPVKTKSEFTKASALISKGINETVAKLSKLTQMAKSKSLFEDNPVAIDELISIIKQDLAKINHQIGQLSDYLAKSQVNNNQNKQHSHNVITTLQTKLATTSDTFKSVLKVRSDNLKQQKQRRDQYSSSSLDTYAQRDSPLYHPERKPTKSVADSTPHSVIDFGASMQTTQMYDNQNSAYLEQRDQTIESIESTIAELGQVYTRFASVLAEQRAMVERIDDNTQQVEMNVMGAHQQLLKYYENISSNRGLMIKSFGVLLVFFLLFVVMT
jgi:syntaxin 5